MQKHRGRRLARTAGSATRSSERRPSYGKKGEDGIRGRGRVGEGGGNSELRWKRRKVSEASINPLHSRSLARSLSSLVSILSETSSRLCAPSASTMLATTRLASLPCSSLSRSCCGPASTSAPSASTSLPRRHREHQRHRRRLASASAASSSPSNEPSDAASPSPAQSQAPQMSLAEAHAALGVSEGSQFDLVSAKNRALADAKGDGERLAKVRIESRIEGASSHHGPYRPCSLPSSSTQCRRARFDLQSSSGKKEQRGHSVGPEKEKNPHRSFPQRPLARSPLARSPLARFSLALSKNISLDPRPTKNNRSSSPTTSS